jgi:hypothetical protein
MLEPEPTAEHDNLDLASAYAALIEGWMRIRLANRPKTSEGEKPHAQCQTPLQSAA